MAHKYDKKFAHGGGWSSPAYRFRQCKWARDSYARLQRRQSKQLLAVLEEDVEVDARFADINDAKALHWHWFIID